MVVNERPTSTCRYRPATTAKTQKVACSPLHVCKVIQKRTRCQTEKVAFGRIYLPIRYTCTHTHIAMCLLHTRLNIKFPLNCHVIQNLIQFKKLTFNVWHLNDSHSKKMQTALKLQPSIAQPILTFANLWFFLLPSLPHQWNYLQEIFSQSDQRTRVTTFGVAQSTFCCIQTKSSKIIFTNLDPNFGIAEGVCACVREKERERESERERTPIF